MDLNNILIGSEDPQRLVSYYRRLFGEPTWNMGGYIGWQVGTGGFVIGAHDQVHGQNPEPGRIIWNVTSQDVRSDFERLKAAGARVIRDPYELGEGDQAGTIATFADPDDNYFQLVSPM